MFFLIPQNVTSERPTALMPTLIRWWEAQRVPELAKWQQKYRVDGDATDGRNGGPQHTYSVGSIHKNGEMALVLDLAKAFERVSLLVVWAWATHFSFPKEDLAGAVR